MPVKTVALPNGETLGYRESGRGDHTLLLVHGNMTSSKHWDVLIDRLAVDFHVVAVDLRGFGESSYHTPVDALCDFAEDLKAFVDALDIAPVTLVGWSTGGGVAMEYAIDHPDDVEGLILVESVGITGYPILEKNGQGEPIEGSYLLTKEAIAADPVQVAPILNAYQNKDKATLRAIWNALIYNEKQPEADRYEAYLDDMLTQRNLVDVDYALSRFNISATHNGVVAGNRRIEQLDVPVLVFQGEKDLVVPPAMGLGIAEALGDQATLVMLEGGHSPLVDNLDRLEAKMRTFLAR